MKYLLSAKSIKANDDYTVSTGIDGQELISRAAAAVLDALQMGGYDLSVPCILCGSGNNGADGFALAQMLVQNGSNACTVYLGKLYEPTPEPKKKKKNQPEVPAIDPDLIGKPNPEAMSDACRARYEQALAAGIPVLHLGDGHKPDEMSEEDAFARLSENLCAILEAGEKHGVTVAIEPHGTFSLTKAGLCRILSVGTPKTLGVNYDACNIFRSAYVESGSASSGWHVAKGKEDELEVLRAVTDRVVHCHAKDVNSQGKCVALGEGLVNVKGCIKHLIASGYQGVVSVETEGNDDFESAVALAKKSYDYLQALVKGEA